MPKVVRTQEGSPGLDMVGLGSLPGNGEGGIPYDVAVGSFPDILDPGADDAANEQAFEEGTGLAVEDISVEEYAEIQGRTGPNDALTLGISQTELMERVQAAAEEQTQQMALSEATREELLDEAKKLGVPGRSGMSKDQLEKAVGEARTSAQPTSESEREEG